MCLIIYNETGAAYTKDQIANAYDTNDDGVGIMWVEDGEVQVLKGLYSKEDTLKLMEQFVDVPHVIHFRMATHGGIKAELAHPFRASHDDADNHVWLMHNGIMHSMGEHEGESDTSAFARQVRQTCEDMDTTDVLFDEYHMETMEEWIGGGNKVIFLRGDGELSILNRKAWTVDDDDPAILYSNTYSIRPRYYGSYNTRRYSAGASGVYPYGASALIDDDDDDTDSEEIEWFTWDGDGDSFIPCSEEQGTFALMEDGTVISIFDDEEIELEVPSATTLREALDFVNGESRYDEEPGDLIYVRTEDGQFEAIGSSIPTDIEEYFLWDGDAMVACGLPVRHPEDTVRPTASALLLPAELGEFDPETGLTS